MGATVGIDVGGTKMLGVALDGAGAVVAEQRTATPHRHRHGTEELAGPAEVLSVISDLARSIVAEVERAGERVDGVGVGVPGLVDDRGVLRFAPNLMHGEGMATAEKLTDDLAVPVVVDNDATCAAVGEWALGAAVGVTDAVVVTLGTGIGGGVIADGRVRRGANGFAGEIGHMVVDPNGPPCSCGRRGCWERYASGSGLGRLAREAALAGRLESVVRRAGGDPESVRSEHVTALAAEGDPAAAKVLAEMGWWLALGLANLADLLDPAMFVVGGGMIEAGAFLLEPARAAFAGMVEAADVRPAIPIEAARLGERAGAMGAAVAARAGERDRAGR